MNAEVLIAKAKANGIVLYIKNQKLAYVCKSGVFPNELKQQIGANKQAIIDWFIADEQQLDGCNIKAQIGDKPFALSFAQQRLWFIDQFEMGENSQYNMPSALEISGPFDAGLAQQALQYIIDRHQILRTVYLQSQDMPLQQVQQQVTLDLPQFDLTHVPVDRQREAVLAHFAEQAKMPFDLSQDLMLRCHWLILSKKAGQQKGVLFFNVHHIVSDGWTLGVLVKEFIALYQAFLHNKPNPLPALTIQYGDYALWQRQQLQGETLKRLEQYWLKQLDGIPMVHSLPLDKPRVGQSEHLADTVVVRLDKQMADNVRKFTAQHAITPFILLHGILALLCARYSNQSDIVIGSPVANRLDKALEPLIGVFINNLILRTTIDPTLDFASYLQQVRQVNLDAQAHQDMPFERLVDLLEVSRSVLYQPLFQVLFAINTSERWQMAMPGMSFERIETPVKQAKFDLEVRAILEEDHLSIEWLFDCDLFHRASIESMSEHFSQLLSHLIAKPSTALNQLPLLSQLDVAKLNALVNTRVLPSDNGLDLTMLLDQWFDDMAGKQPDSIALRFRDESISYQTLFERSNQLARYFIECYRAQDIDWSHQDSRFIGVAMSPSIETVVVLLAVLKAGCCYVPLDPSYPSARLSYMIDDAHLTLVVTQQSLTSLFAQSQCNLLTIEQINQHISTVSHGAILPHERLTERNHQQLAYMIYTSGSTGLPKGVMISHQAATHFIVAMLNAVFGAVLDSQADIDNRNPWLLLTSISFDIALFEWFGCLASGNTCVIATEQQQEDPQALIELIASEPIGLIQATPSRWLQLFEAGLDRSIAPAIGLSGGEALTPELLPRFAASAMELYNCYGPTEATVWSLVNKVDFTLSVEQQLTLGTSLANYQHVVLDQFNQVMPQGGIGQLYIGGHSLAEGYFHRQSLTADRFVHLNLDGQGLKRWYATGDLAQIGQDGLLYFHGRIDNQVKVRGHRIELGEIEQQLLEIDGVQMAAVVAQSHDTFGAQLVAFVVVDKEAKALATTDQIKTQLADKLPDYMLPAFVEFLPSMPLTSNGKVDKKALPKLDMAKQHQARYVAPVTEAQVRLCQVWQQLLKVEQIGINDNFFELGGHSLLIIRLLFDMKQVGFAFTTRDVMENPTVADLLALDQQKAQQDLLQDDLAINDGDIISLPNRQRLYQGPHQHHWNIAGICLVHQANPELLNLAIKQMFELHVGLRHCFVLQADGMVIEQQLSLDDLVYLELQDLSALDSIEAKDHALERLANQYQRQMRLDSRLHRLVLFDYGEGEAARFLWIFQHALLDGYSHGLFCDELILRYLSLVADIAVPVLPQSDTLARWARHLHQYANHPQALEVEKGYWQGLDWSRIHLLADFPKGIAANMGDDVSVYGQDLWIEQPLDVETSQSLLQQSWRNKAITAADVVNFAFAKALAKATDTDAVFFDTVCSGRDSLRPDVDVSHTLGWFSDTCPTWLHINHKEDIANQIQSIKQQQSQVPTMGLGINAIKTLCEDQSIRQWFNDLPQAEVLLNYVPPQLSHPEDTRSLALPWHLIDTTAQIYGDTEGQDHCAIAWPSYVLISYQQQCFQIAWSGRDNIYTEKTIRQVTTLWIEIIKEAVNSLKSI